MKKCIKILTTVMVLVILLSVVLCFASCNDKSTLEYADIKLINENNWYYNSDSSDAVGRSYLLLRYIADGYTLRFESNDAWGLYAITPIAGKKAGDSLNGRAIDIKERTEMIGVSFDGLDKETPGELYVCLSFMRGYKCVGYEILKLKVPMPGEIFGVEHVSYCDVELFDKPQPYSKVKQVFAKYKAE